MNFISRAAGGTSAVTLNMNKDQLTCNRPTAELLEQLEQPPQPGAKVTAARGYTEERRSGTMLHRSPVQVESPAPSSPRRERGAADGGWVDARGALNWEKGAIDRKFT